MIITCLGHAKFLLELENGMKLVTDPFDPGTGYPIHPLEVDAALVSHGHHDHSAVDTLSACGQVVNTAGIHTLATDVTVTSVSCFHDDVQGAKRGKNLIHILDAEGLRVVHMGDIGHPLTDELVSSIGQVDVLMLPVGGFYTIDAREAKRVCDTLKPAVILPMHYRTEYNADWPIAPVQDFTGLFPEPVEHLPLLRITAGDLKCQPKLAVLDAQC